MEMQVSLADLQAARAVAAGVDPNPIRVAGRLLGLSGAEQNGRVPFWGYVAVGVGAGFLLGIWASRAEFLQRVLPSK
jgi:hypothetical protein